jgi:Ser/Thr protein kinase RdoA (MazF antagonist)
MTPARPASYARGVRLRYADLPPAVHAWVQQQLSGPVTHVEDREGGFAPGCAAVVRTAERAAFCKATGSVPNAVALELYRGERARLAALPDHPSLPKPIAAADLVLADQDWAVTLLPALPGEPPQHPWTEPVARLVLDRLADLQTTLTAAAGGSAAAALPGSDHLAAFFHPWSEVLEDPADPWRRDPWVRDRRGALEESSALLGAAVVGEVPVHADLRADNILVGRPAGPGAEPPVWFVDWAAAVRAAPWVDPAILACDFVVSRADHRQGGSMEVAAFLAAHPVTAAIEPALRWAMMTGLAVTLHRLGQQDDPPGLPTLRRWQRRCADDLLDFVRTADLGSGRRLW